jgi:hypothetical protein
MFFKKWPETPATVWSVNSAARGWMGRRYLVIVNYQVDRRYYSSEILTRKLYVAGEVFPLRVNLKNPRKNELAVRNKVAKVVPWVVLAVVAVGLVYALFYAIPGAGPGAR